ncbi:MAG: hypothetical protein A2X86_08610 [Bdellovibrionales bacterium GWA2_49_15]|nr:MAG: hypothetical protein A2X86_08610 [Bdellovibrionales bacterium GWA2_49_15]HAZ11176.1 hypothetical protein [Bdellovibrionales bacterium]
MNLKKISDKNLHESTLAAAKKEKLSTLELLRHLAEVQRRVLYAEYGYSTLQKYVMRELGYSEAESWTRIQAMKLIRTSELAEAKIAEGSLSLSNAAEVQKHIQEFNFTMPDKIAETINLATRKSHRELVQELDDQAGREKSEKKIILPKRLLEKMAKLNKLLDAKMTELELIETLLDKEIRECEVRPSRTSQADCVKPTRYLPVRVRRSVMTRANHQCEFRDKNAKRCGERRHLQFDHIKPFALGGDRSEKNLQLLCPAHNQRRMIKTFGARDR